MDLITYIAEQTCKEYLVTMPEMKTKIGTIKLAKDARDTAITICAYFELGHKNIAKFFGVSNQRVTNIYTAMNKRGLDSKGGRIKRAVTEYQLTQL